MELLCYSELIRTYPIILTLKLTKTWLEQQKLWNLPYFIKLKNVKYKKFKVSDTFFALHYFAQRSNVTELLESFASTVQDVFYSP